MKILAETNKTKVLHIKIPKNGTHSINNFLQKNNLDNWNRKYLFGHDPLYTLKKNNNIDNNTFIFCVSRNPYTRFYSQYHQLIRTLKGYENKTNIDFYLDVKNKNLHPIFTSPQIFWIGKEKNNILPNVSTFYDANNSIYKDYFIPDDLDMIDVDRIYKLENIFEFEKDFEIELQVHNKSNYNIFDYKKFFTEKIVNFIKNYYRKDFLFFNYDFDFNSSIKKFSYIYQ